MVVVIKGIVVVVEKIVDDCCWNEKAVVVVVVVVDEEEVNVVEGHSVTLVAPVIAWAYLDYYLYSFFHFLINFN